MHLRPILERHTLPRRHSTVDHVQHEPCVAVVQGLRHTEHECAAILRARVDGHSERCVSVAYREGEVGVVGAHNEAISL